MAELFFLIYNFKDNLIEFFFLLFTFSELLQTKLTEIWKEDQTLPENERIWSCRSRNRFVTSQSDLVCRPSPALWGSVRALPELCEDPTKRTLWSSWLNESWIILILLSFCKKNGEFYINAIFLKFFYIRFWTCFAQLDIRLKSTTKPNSK